MNGPDRNKTKSLYAFVHDKQILYIGNWVCN